MKLIFTPVFLVIFLLGFHLSSAQKAKQVEIQTFAMTKLKGDLVLQDSSIVLSNTMKNFSTELSVEDS